jgi:hypothetical protein
MFSRCKQSKVSGIGLLRRLSKLQAEAPTNAGASKSHRAELPARPTAPAGFHSEVATAMIALFNFLP